ncbi:vascular endothelial growth factor A-like [Gigantopelta aegis]|uniref:vascular endothelial growth factor A-like n=1 Tax=Gigantopelta aegis TaxID=1735272 RepID=UPI001B88C815|nr:vascular endothelial growth factor A-like [Gigantopelta aegis]
MNTKAILFLFGLIATEVCITSGRESLLQAIEKARTAEEFLQYVMINGHPARLSDVYMQTDENGEQVYASDAYRRPISDECGPRLTTVKIPRELGDHNIIYFPKCTPIERCGGCCAEDKHKCHPTRTETVEIHVLTARIPHPGAGHFAWAGIRTVHFERHLACGPACKITREDCNVTQTYNKMDCSCRCYYQRPCFPLQTWDEATCSCKCRTVLNCSPSTFNPETCQCEINGGKTDPNTTQSYNPCLTQFCPPRFHKTVYPNKPNRCVCTPPFFGPGRK